MISIIIPVSKNHISYLASALKSIELQECEEEVEVVIVNDSDVEVPLARINTGGGYGPAKCRNMGAKEAVGNFFMFLDADDTLIQGSLQRLLDEYNKTGYIPYGNLIRGDTNEVVNLEPPYCGENLHKTSLSSPKRQLTCCLIPREVHETIGGFDETLPLREDIEYEIAIDVAGFCCNKVEYPVYYYRMNTGTRRIQDETDKALRDTAREMIYNKYVDYYKGRKKMGCQGGCGDKVVNNNNKIKQIANNELNMTELLRENDVFLEYIYPEVETKTLRGPVTNSDYRFGNNAPRNKKKQVGTGQGQVNPQDAQEMYNWNRRNFSLFRVVTVPRQKVEVQKPVKEFVPVKLLSDTEDIKAEVMRMMEQRKQQLED